MINLMYHDVYISENSESGLASDLYKLHIDDFRAQISTISNYIGKGAEITLTFDDGGSSFYTPIADILEENDLSGIFFVATKFIGTKGFLNRSQIKELEQRGHRIGSHSHSHPENIASLTDKAVEIEWKKSAEILENILGHKTNLASIPNGYISDKVIQAANMAGYDHIYTSVPTMKIKSYDGLKISGRFVVLANTNMTQIHRIINSRGYRFIQFIKCKILSIPKYLLGNKYEDFKKMILK